MIIPSPQQSTLAIAATFTAEPLLPALQLLLEEAGLELNVQFAPYHQVFQELLSPNSLLAANGSGVDVVLLRLEDFVRDVSNAEQARPIVERSAQEFLEALHQHVRRAKVPTIVAVLPPSPDVVTTLQPSLCATSHELTEKVRALPGIVLLSSEEVDLVSAGERYELLG